MAAFRDGRGARWFATVSREEGPDYKGRYRLVFTSPGAGTFPLDDVRWNSEGSARRTIGAMSEGELRRRLKLALGRSSAP